MADSSIARMRIDYSKDELDELQVDADPFDQFSTWFEQARASGSAVEVNAMTIATVTPEGQPAVRSVLLKGFDHGGLTFYTSYLSAKGLELAGNPHAAAHFLWPGLERQVRVNGVIEKVSREESDAYFQTRPRGSQIAAHLGMQSQVIPGRGVLEQRYAELEREFGDGEIAAPDYWGGYRLVPQMFEFWQGRSSRLHDRIRYRLEAEGKWVIERLGP